MRKSSDIKDCEEIENLKIENGNVCRVSGKKKKELKKFDGLVLVEMFKKICQNKIHS